MTGIISLLKNGKEMRTAYFSSKKHRREIAKEWESEVKRLVKHSPYFETVLSIYELSIILNHDPTTANLCPSSKQVYYRTGSVERIRSLPIVKFNKSHP